MCILEQEKSALRSNSPERPMPARLSESLRANTRLHVASIDETVLAPLVEAAVMRAQKLPRATEAAITETVALRQLKARPGIFEQALAAPGAHMILEVKQASPSRRVTRSTVNIEDYATQLNHYADAISVLTEPKFFGGSFERLAALRALTDKPLLAKDFFVSPRQILAAARAGADAILLMLSVLSDSGFLELFRLAQALNLEVLCEASSPEELKRAAQLDVRIVGINNRNLRTLEVDLTRAPTLSRLPEAQAFPVLIAESGYTSFESVERAFLAAPRLHAFLCGSVLSLSTDLSTSVRKLLFGHTKVCGITRVEDALAAAQAGATSIGLILAPRSSRYVPPTQAFYLAKAIRETCQKAKASVEICAVIDAPENPSAVLALLGPLKDTIDALQLHAPLERLTPTYLAALHTALPSIRLIPAFGIDSLANAQTAAQTIRLALQSQTIDHALLDAVSPSGTSGGTGQLIPLPLLEAFRGIPRLVLAGGLSTQTLPKILATAFQAGIPLFGVDLNSGVEVCPGIKSLPKLNTAFAAIRGMVSV